MLPQREVYYIRIRENTLIIRSVINPKKITVKAKEPFSTKRLLVGQFSVAERLLKAALQQFEKSLLLSPDIIVHPLEKTDGKLSEVEEKVLKELALSAGARMVRLWVGAELTEEELCAWIKKEHNGINAKISIVGKHMGN